MATHEKKPLLSSSDSEEYGRKFDTFPRNVQIQEGARLGAETATPKRRYRCNNFLPCDPRRYMHRFLMLILMCFLSFGENEGGKFITHGKLQDILFQKLP